MKKRIIGIIFISIIWVPLIILGGYYFKIGLGIFSLLALKEILDLKESHQELPLFIKIISYLLLLLIVYQNVSVNWLGYNLDYYVINYSVLGIIGLLLLLLTLFVPKYDTKDAFYLIGTIIMIGLAFNILLLMRLNNYYLFLYLLSIPIFSDFFAYLVGFLLGKHKLIPKISPHKSVEGLIGGLVIGTILSLIIYNLLIGSINIRIIIITIILNGLGQIGDLIFSKIKRENKIKDFSNIIPGHGGILDRIDSLVVVMISYIILISIM